MKLKRITLVAIITTVLLAIAGLQAGEYIPGHLVVKFEHGILDMAGVESTPVAQVSINNAEIVSALQSFGAQNVKKVFTSDDAQATETYIDVSQVCLFKVNPNLDMKQVAAQMSQLPGVIYAEPDGYIVFHHVAPNDPYFEYGTVGNTELYNYQWGFNHTHIGNTEWDINILSAWDIDTCRSDIKLAIIDQGLEYLHQDGIYDEFYGRVIGGFPSLSDALDEGGEHGTKVAGLAAAATNNLDPEITDKGIAGVAGGWYDGFNIPGGQGGGVSLLIADLTDNPDPENTPSAVWAADAIDWARFSGAHIINCSWGETEPMQTLDDAIKNAIAEDVTVFFASGNQYDDPDTPGYDLPVDKVDYPACLAEYDICCAVGAMTEMGQRYIESCYGSELSFVAPGRCMVTTRSVGEGAPHAEYADFSSNFTGTSAAAPMAAGVGALLYSQALERAHEPYSGSWHDELCDVDCKRLMEYTAQYNGEDYPVPDKITVIGNHAFPFHNEIGYGCVNAYAALRRLDDPYIFVHTYSPYEYWSGATRVGDDVQVGFIHSPNEHYPSGFYRCNVYEVSGPVFFPADMSDHWVWPLLFKGTPGYNYEVGETCDAMPHVEIDAVTSYHAIFKTYIYELLYKWIEGEEYWESILEDQKWAPRRYEEMDKIYFTLNGIVEGPSPSPELAVMEDIAPPTLTITSSDLGDAFTVNYQIPQLSNANIAIYDVTGREVKTLVSGEQPAGSHELTWKGVDNTGHSVSAGVYFIRMETEGFQDRKKITLIR
jgi:subtilisin family serine protease